MFNACGTQNANSEQVETGAGLIAPQPHLVIVAMMGPRWMHGRGVSGSRGALLPQIADDAGLYVGLLQSVHR